MHTGAKERTNAFFCFLPYFPFINIQERERSVPRCVDDASVVAVLFMQSVEAGNDTAVAARRKKVVLFLPASSCRCALGG